MLTPEGAKKLLADSLEGAQMRVTDGRQSASAPFDSGFPQHEQQAAGARAHVEATFGENAANFDWKERQIVAKDGTVLDRTVEDHGRKAAGSVWTLRHSIELGAATPEQ